MTLDELRNHCWIRAREAFGTSYIFESRLKWPRSGLRLVNYVGLGVPLAIGLLVLGFGTDAQQVSRAVPYAATMLVGQGLLALWALVAEWQTTIDSSFISATENNRLSNAYKDLAARTPSGFEALVQVVDAQYQARSEADLRLAVTEDEKRKGMRAGLRQFQAPCAGCQQVPTSMSPSDCPVCGSF